MAYSNEGAYQFSWPADADFSDIATKQYIAVALGVAQNVRGYGQGGIAVLPYAAGQTFIGILENAPKQGQEALVAMRGIMRCKCGTPWSAGDKLSVGANGLLQPAGASDTVFGIAGESAVVGDISTVIRP